MGYKEKTGEVNFWATGMHGAEIGLKQKEQWMAKSRQFTRDTDIYGSVSEDEKEVGFVAYRENLWNEEKRLVVKIFSKGGTWKGSMEELIGEELKKSLYADKPSPVFAIILPRYDYVTVVERVFRPGLMQKEAYAFRIINKDRTLEVYSVVGARASLGNDFKVIRENDTKEVGKLDSKVLDIGGKVHIELKDELAAKNDILFDILVCFAASLKFLDDIKDAINDRLKRLDKEKLKYRVELDRDEVLLYTNPRRIKV